MAARCSTERLAERLTRAVEAWGRSTWSPDETASVMRVFGDRLREVDHPAPVGDLAMQRAARWLAEQRGRPATRSAVGALRSWDSFRDLALERYGTLTAGLRADEARVVLEELLDTTDPNTVLLAASTEVDPDLAQRLVIPVLSTTLQTAPKVTHTAFEAASARARLPCSPRPSGRPRRCRIGSGNWRLRR